MSTIKANEKSKILDLINSIEDRNILNEINRLLEVDIEDSIYLTTSEQQQEIVEARLQLSQKEGIPSTEADDEIEKWLSK